MGRSARLIIALGLVMASALTMSAVGKAAPPEPQAVTLPCATNMFIQMLGRSVPPTAEGQALVLVRATFEPGGSIGPHTHPGTLVISVESGVFGFTLVDDHGEMTVMRAGDAGTPVAAESLVPGEEVQLQPGDWVVETGMVHTARAVGDEPAVVVFSGLVTDGQPLTTCVEGTPAP